MISCSEREIAHEGAYRFSVLASWASMFVHFAETQKSQSKMQARGVGADRAW